MFKDHFSTQSADYAKYRPVYPQALYDFILAYTHNRRTAWDCATGNGQVAVALASHFQHIIATDASENQIAHAKAQDGVAYHVATAEDSGIMDHSIDLITVGQAMHWFNFEAFYKEVRRVAAEGCFLAVWSYGQHSISPEVDSLVKQFNEEMVGPYWPPERKYVDDGYQSINFPFEQVQAPPIEMSLDIPLMALAGYLKTWSSTQRFIKVQGYDPVETLLPELAEAWGNPEEIKRITWPLIIKAGYVG